MQDDRMRVHLFASLLISAVGLAPALVLAQDYADEAAVPVEAEAPAQPESQPEPQAESPPDAAQPEEPAPAADSEEHAQVRSELEQRNAQQAESRQKNCDGARAEIQKLANIPARRVMRPNEDGTLGRMSEEEYEARLKRLRELEAENCQ
jgi:hypothetical protein